MKKILIIFIITLMSYVSYGQNLTFSPELSAYSNDPNVPLIAALWKDYLTSCKQNDCKSSHNDLWLECTEDLFRFNNIYMWKQFTYNIRKLNDNIYEINTISYFDAPEGIIVNDIYKVCAVKDDDGKFKLISYFDVVKERLNHVATDNIDYYYVADKVLDKAAAGQAEKFVKGFKETYNICDDSKIIYILANNLDECNSLLGMTYTMMRSEHEYAGCTVHRTILSTRPDHIHELVHGIMIPVFPDAPLFLHEGIATYYGGGANRSYKFHSDNLRQNISTIKIDFTDIDSLHQQLDGKTSLFNTLGALIIEYVLENYSYDKVLELFESKTYKDVFLKLGISEEGINDFILQKIIQ